MHLKFEKSARMRICLNWFKEKNTENQGAQINQQEKAVTVKISNGSHSTSVTSDKGKTTTFETLLMYMKFVHVLSF